MTGFVDPTDRAEVERVLSRAVSVIGLVGVVEQLAGAGGLDVRRGRPGGFLRQELPTVLTVDDQSLAVASNGSARLQHTVADVVLSHDRVAPARVPAVLADLLARSVASSGAHDQLAVSLTALRDAVEAQP